MHSRQAFIHPDVPQRIDPPTLEQLILLHPCMTPFEPLSEEPCGNLVIAAHTHVLQHRLLKCRELVKEFHPFTCPLPN